MPTIKIYDAATCCSEAKDAPADYADANPALNVEHITIDPDADASQHPAVAAFLFIAGKDGLPLTLVDNTTVLTGRYPTQDELERWANLALPADNDETLPLVNESGCQCGMDSTEGCGCGCGCGCGSSEKGQCSCGCGCGCGCRNKKSGDAGCSCGCGCGCGCSADCKCGCQDNKPCSCNPKGECCGKKSDEQPQHEGKECCKRERKRTCGCKGKKHR